MHTLSAITVSEKPANDETKAVAAMLIEECFSLPYIIAECRQGITTEAVARIRLIAKLGNIVCDCLPPAPEAFVDAARSVLSQMLPGNAIKSIHQGYIERKAARPSTAAHKAWETRRRKEVSI